MKIINALIKIRKITLYSAISSSIGKMMLSSQPFNGFCFFFSLLSFSSFHPIPSERFFIFGIPLCIHYFRFNLHILPRGAIFKWNYFIHSYKWLTLFNRNTALKCVTGANSWNFYKSHKNFITFWNSIHVEQCTVRTNGMQNQWREKNNISPNDCVWVCVFEKLKSICVKRDTKSKDKNKHMENPKSNRKKDMKTSFE